MRLVLLISVLAFSASASAQARFVSECQRSAPSLEVDYGAVCECAAQRVLARGATPAALDSAADLLVQGAEVDPETVSQETLLVTNLAMTAILNCGTEAGIGGSSDPAVKARLSGQAPTPDPEQALEGVPMTPEALAAEAAAAATSELPTGLRTGNGNEPVRARQQGKGAVIRIVG